MCIFVLASPALQSLRRGVNRSPKILQTGAVSPICSAFGTEGGSKPRSVQKARQTDISEEQILGANFTQDASIVMFSLYRGCILKATLPSGFTFCVLIHVPEQSQCTQDPTEMTQN